MTDSSDIYLKIVLSWEILCGVTGKLIKPFIEFLVGLECQKPSFLTYKAQSNFIHDLQKIILHK